MSAKDVRPAAANGRTAKERLPVQYTQSPADRLLSRLERIRQTGPGRWMARVFWLLVTDQGAARV